MLVTGEKVENLLRELGDTPEKVAGTLRQANVRGKIDSVTSCPVAKYLKSRLGRTYTVGVGLNYVDVWADLGEKKTASVELPESVKQFIRNFDAGRYPDLVQTES